MKKFAVVQSLVLLLCVCLAGCGGNAKTPAEAYLASSSEQEILDYFQQITYVGTDFTDPKKLTSDQLLDFATAGANHGGPLAPYQWFDEESFAFLVPMEQLYAVFDQYFADYVFDPAELKYEEYDAENDILVISAVGGGDGSRDVAFGSAETVDAENLRVLLYLFSCEYPEPTLDPYASELYITAKIVDGQPRFTGYQQKPAPWRTE